MLTIPQAIFFDFDGVIVESADIKTEAFLELFKDHPSIVPAVRTYHLNNMGVSRFRKFEWIYKNLLHKNITEQELTSLGNKFSKIVFDKVVAAPFVPGALELLRDIHAHCTCIIASGTPEEELQQIVHARNLAPYFKEVCGTPRTKTQIVQELLGKYNLHPETCWFIGDANTDLEAARATGLTFIARYTEPLKEYWGRQQDILIVRSLQEIRDRLEI